MFGDVLRVLYLLWPLRGEEGQIFVTPGAGHCNACVQTPAGTGSDGRSLTGPGPLGGLLTEDFV